MRRLLFLVFIGLMSCSEERLTPLVDDRDYFPVRLGQFYEYAVEETTHSLLGEVNTAYEIREEFFDVIVTGSDTTFLVKRFTRPDSTFSWEQDSVYSLRRTAGQLIVTENNIPFVRLTFPVMIGNEWNGNAFNALPQANYELMDGGKSLSPLTIADLVKVQISDIPQTLVRQDQRYHLYGRGIGLVEKNYIRINFVTSGQNLGTIESGRILKQYLKKYGQD